ncbi:hypothetical protein ACQJBY_010927 [Aegilops geniculata]
MATALGYHDAKGVASSVRSVAVAVDALPAPPRLSVVVELPPSSLTLTLHPTAMETWRNTWKMKNLRCHICSCPAVHRSGSDAAAVQRPSSRKRRHRPTPTRHLQGHPSSHLPLTQPIVSLVRALLIWSLSRATDRPLQRLAIVFQSVSRESMQHVKSFSKALTNRGSLQFGTCLI